MKWFIWLFLTVILLISDPGLVKAEQEQTFCDNRYLTLVNPVRSRELWHDKSLSSIDNQYRAIQKNGFPATWLVQYDVLLDRELLEKINSFDSLQEKGVFLEVSKELTDEARVLYPIYTPWFKPNAVFLSGYSQSERRSLIDSLFNKFKQQFGSYPKSVGAWWIDSYSLEYLKQKYQIGSALIVADQQTTDNYGVWGQWWGVPYYPSKANILVPASSMENKQGVVVLQWAQRDPLRAYGAGPAISNYSLQANDYIRQGETTDYFKQISESFLSCENKLGQITVGLETGIESIGFIGEYENQLEYLKTRPNLKAVTMSQFADAFTKAYPQFPKTTTISYSGSIWHLTPQKRKNNKLNDSIFYAQNNSFSDYFTPDKSEFLNRKLDTLEKGKTKIFRPFYLVVFLLAGVFYYLKKEFLLYIFGSIFLFNAFGLLFRSTAKYGWVVYYGLVVESLQLVQIALAAVFFYALFLIFQQKYLHNFKNKLFLSLLSLSFGLDFLLSRLRLTILENKYYLGLAVDTFRFLGISFSKDFHFQFINRDFEGYQLNAFLKFDYEKIWQNNLIVLIIFPIIHVLAAFIIYFILRKFPLKIRIIFLSMLVLLWFGYIFQIVSSDPRIVLPNK